MVCLDTTFIPGSDSLEVNVLAVSASIGSSSSLALTAASLLPPSLLAHQFALSICPSVVIHPPVTSGSCYHLGTFQPATECLGRDAAG